MIQTDLQIDDQFVDKVNGEALSTAVEETLRQQGITQASVTVVVTDDETVHQLNRTFRDVDGPTDILSFPNHEFGANEFSQEVAEEPHAQVVPRLVLPPELIAEEESYLGDLIISFPYTQRQSLAQKRPLDAELVLLVIHGTLHLLGHDHADAQQEAAMWALQNQVLNSLGYESVTP